jgi:hypothetical protein
MKKYNTTFNQTQDKRVLFSFKRQWPALVKAIVRPKYPKEDRAGLESFIV